MWRIVMNLASRIASLDTCPRCGTTANGAIGELHRAAEIVSKVVIVLLTLQDLIEAC